MIIKQEENSPVCDLFDRLKLAVAFNGIEEMSTGRVIDSNLMHEYINGTISILRDLDKGLSNIEKDLEKKKNKEAFRERLYGNDPYGD